MATAGRAQEPGPGRDQGSRPAGGTPRQGAGPAWWAAALVLLAISHLWTIRYMWSYRWFHGDGLYNHAPLVVLFGLYLLWRRRPALLALPARPSPWGLPLLGLGILLHLGARFTFRDSLSAFSLLPILLGLVLLFEGPRRTRAVAPLVGLLLFVAPLPDQLLKLFTFPLKMACTEAGAWFAGLFITGGMERVGTEFRYAGQAGVLVVGEACSGMRSAIALLTLAYCQAFFFGPPGWRRTLLLIAALPVAFLANSLRIGILAVAGSAFGVESATGLFHDIMGYGLYLVAIALLLLLDLGLRRLLPPPPEREEEG